MKTKKKVTKKSTTKQKPITVTVNVVKRSPMEGPLVMFMRLAETLSIATKKALKAKNWVEYGACMAELQKAQEAFDQAFPTFKNNG